MRSNFAGIVGHAALHQLHRNLSRQAHAVPQRQAVVRRVFVGAEASRAQKFLRCLGIVHAVFASSTHRQIKFSLVRAQIICLSGERCQISRFAATVKPVKRRKSQQSRHATARKSFQTRRRVHLWQLQNHIHPSRQRHLCPQPFVKAADLAALTKSPAHHRNNDRLWTICTNLINKTLVPIMKRIPFRHDADGCHSARSFR